MKPLMYEAILVSLIPNEQFGAEYRWVQNWPGVGVVRYISVPNRQVQPGTSTDNSNGIAIQLKFHQFRRLTVMVLRPLHFSVIDKSYLSHDRLRYTNRKIVSIRMFDHVCCYRN